MHIVDILLCHFCSFKYYTVDRLEDLWSPNLTEIVCNWRIAKIEMVYLDMTSVVSVKFQVKWCSWPRKS